MVIKGGPLRAQGFNEHLNQRGECQMNIVDAITQSQIRTDLPKLVIGDTVRVSLTADPKEEIKAAREILKAVGYNANGINLVSCPTCGRTQIDLVSLVNEFESRIDDIKISRPITVALMGCVVNGPGEAREADIGIAGGKGEALLIKKGQIIRKIPEDKIIDQLIEEIEKLD